MALSVAALERSRRWRERHPEKKREDSRRYRAEHRDNIRAFRSSEQYHAKERARYHARVATGWRPTGKHQEPLEPIPEFYPYVLTGAGALPEIMQQVLEATKDLPEQIRPDVCQSIFADMLAGDLAYEDLHVRLPHYKRAAFPLWVVSLDTPVGEGQLLRDVI